MFVYVVGFMWIPGTPILFWAALGVALGAWGKPLSPEDHLLLQTLEAGMLICAVGAPALAVVVSLLSRRWGGAAFTAGMLAVSVLVAMYMGLFDPRQIDMHQIGHQILEALRARRPASPRGVPCYSGSNSCPGG